MNTIQKIIANYQKLTHKQRQIADYLLTNPENVCYISLKELGEHTGTSEVTILRLCRALGFRNYIELKQSFRRHTKELIDNLDGTSLFPCEALLSEGEDKTQAFEKIRRSEFEKSADFYRSLKAEDVFRAARRILTARRVLIFGHGITKTVADFFNRRLTPLGVNSISVNPEDMEHVQACLAKLNEDDHVIVISFPRYYTPIHNIALYSQSKGATVMAVTDSPDSPAVTDKSLNFFCRTSTKIFFNSMELPFALINLIATGIALEMGPQYEKLMATTHEVVHCIRNEQDG